MRPICSEISLQAYLETMSKDFQIKSGSDCDTFAVRQEVFAFGIFGELKRLNQ